MIFLAPPEVFRLHARLIELYGGSTGVRDPGLLLSALAQPEATLDGALLHVDLAARAAAYAFHLAQNHPFVDGNKRTALAAMLVFLELNGSPLHVSQEEMYAVMVGVAEGRIGKTALATWLRDRLRSP